MELPQAGQSGKSGRRWGCVRWSRIIIRLDTRTAHRFAVTFVTGRRMVRSASITIERRVDFRLGQIVVNATGVPCAPSRGTLSWPRCCAAPCRRFRICRGKCRGLRGDARRSRQSVPRTPPSALPAIRSWPSSNCGARAPRGSPAAPAPIPAPAARKGSAAIALRSCVAAEAAAEPSRRLARYTGRSRATVRLITFNLFERRCDALPMRAARIECPGCFRVLVFEENSN